MSPTQADLSQLIPLARILRSADRYGMFLDNTFTIAVKDVWAVRVRTGKSSRNSQAYSENEHDEKQLAIRA
jgi:hypothetical protein